MNRIIPIITLIFVTALSQAQNFTIQVDTLREYRLHLPVNYNPSDTYPLVFAFHGGFGLDWQFENETGFSDLADTANIIVVYPQAIGTTRSWNTGICCGWAYNNNISDLDFVESLVNHLTATYSVDTSQIYATGFSSGAMMTYAVGCKLSSYFAAIAPVSSSMLIDACEPDCTPVPVIHLHAEPDSSALFHGGYSSNPLLQFYYPPVDSVMTSWSVKNDCNPIIDSIFLENGTKVYRWNNCRDNTYQEIWLADEGGHKWPGTKGTGVLSGDSATQDFFATEVVWNFLKKHSKSCSQQTFDISAGVEPLNSGTIAGTGSYNYGETAELTATPKTGYEFINWTEGGAEVSTNATYSFTVTENRTLLANFNFIVGIERINNNNISVYPIPTKGILYITLNGNTVNSKVSLFNLLGEKVLTLNHKGFVDLNGLPEGTYFLKLEINNQTETYKIIKTE